MLTEVELLPAVLRVLQDAHVEREHGHAAETLVAKAKAVVSIKEQAAMHVPLNSDSDDNLDDDSDDTTHRSDTPSLKDVLESLKNDVDALVELGHSLEDPVPDTLVTGPSVLSLQVGSGEYMYHTFFEGIKQKFPECDDSLAMALSKALYDNTMRLHAERQAAGSSVVEEPEVAGKPVKDSGYGTSLRDSAHDQGALHESAWATGSSYASTLASCADVDDRGVRTPFPSQPKDLRVGESFCCIACGRRVAKSESGAAWRYGYVVACLTTYQALWLTKCIDGTCSRICGRGSAAKCHVNAFASHTARGKSGSNIFNPSTRFTLTGMIRSARSASGSLQREGVR